MPAEEGGDLDEGADMLVEEHHADQACNRRRDRIDGDQQRLVGRRTADDRVGLHGQQQADRQRKHRDEDGEYACKLGDAEIFGAEKRI